MKTIYKPILFVMTFLLVSGASLNSGFAATIELSNNPRFSINGCLTYFYAKVPVQQIRISADGNAVEITGDIHVDLSRLPETKRATVLRSLQEWFFNKGTWRGLTVDLSQANLTFNSQQKAIQEEGSVETLSSGHDLYRDRAQDRDTKPLIDDALLEIARAEQSWKKSCEDYLGTPPVDKP